MERIVFKHASPEEAERATREAYRAMSGNERVALTVPLQRRYYESADDAPRRLERVVTTIRGRDR